MMFAAIALHPARVDVRHAHQILHVLPILLIMQLIVLGVRQAAADNFPGGGFPSALSARCCGRRRTCC